MEKSIIQKSIITSLTPEELFTLQRSFSNRIIVVKFGAEWCGPCKKIEPLITQWFNHCPDSVACYKIDIDESFELYATFKTKRQVNGIPALLCFRKGNLDVIPDFTVTGADTTQVNQFFQQIIGETK